MFQSIDSASTAALDVRSLSGGLPESQWRAAHADFVGIVDDLAAGWATSPEDMPARLVTRFPEFGEIRVRDVVVHGQHGSVPVRVYEPAGIPVSTVMWIHGGAFVVGDLDMPEANWVSLTLASKGHTVVSVDYQKARGEVHYPVPSDDVRAAWRWIVAQDAVDPVPGGIHLGGGSAGGALAAGLVVRLRDAGERLPASVALVYPVVHPRLPPLSDELAAAVESIPPEERVDPKFFDGMHFAFAGSMETLSDPHAFAGLADLKGLPPTFILNSERDYLRASGELFAAQLADAGVSVSRVTETGSAHGQLNHTTNTFGIRSVNRLCDWLNKQTALTASELAGRRHR